MKDFAPIAVVVAVYMTIFSIITMIAGLMADFSIGVFFDEDLPFWADCAIAVVLNVINVTAFVIAVILHLCGY